MSAEDRANDFLGYAVLAPLRALLQSEYDLGHRRGADTGVAKNDALIAQLTRERDEWRERFEALRKATAPGGGE